MRLSKEEYTGRLFPTHILLYSFVITFCCILVISVQNIVLNITISYFI